MRDRRPPTQPRGSAPRGAHAMIVFRFDDDGAEFALFDAQLDSARQADLHTAFRAEIERRRLAGLPTTGIYRRRSGAALSAHRTRKGAAA